MMGIKGSPWLTPSLSADYQKHCNINFNKIKLHDVINFESHSVRIGSGAIRCVGILFTSNLMNKIMIIVYR